MDRRKLCLRKALYFGLIPPTLAVTQENAVQTCSQASLMSSSSVEVSSSQVCNTDNHGHPSQYRSQFMNLNQSS